MKAGALPLSYRHEARIVPILFAIKDARWQATQEAATYLSMPNHLAPFLHLRCTLPLRNSGYYRRLCKR